MFSPRHRRRTQSRIRQVRRLNSTRRTRIREHSKARRSLAQRNLSEPFYPTEDWYEPTGSDGYRVIEKSPGEGHLHVVTEEQVRDRLAQLPQHFVRDLEIVQLSCMTRKKHCFPCYGMQWGSAIYLYPFDETFEEHFDRPPPRALVIEAKMFGARWDRPTPESWRLKWSEQSARDFQLNNVLIHELGHLIDKRNTNYMDQERFAEWFAIEYGYLKSGGKLTRRRRQNIRRRHHGL